MLLPWLMKKKVLKSGLKVFFNLSFLWNMAHVNAVAEEAAREKLL